MRRDSSVRARYRWRGPEWAEWSEQNGSRARFDLGIYEPRERVRFHRIRAKDCARPWLGLRFGARPVNSRPVKLDEVEDTAGMLLQLGASRFAHCRRRRRDAGPTLGLRSSCMESQVSCSCGRGLGSGWLRTSTRRRAAPGDLAGDGADVASNQQCPRHLVDSISRQICHRCSGPSHALHVLEIDLEATRASATGQTMRSRAAPRSTTASLKSAFRPAHASITTTGSSRLRSVATRRSRFSPADVRRSSCASSTRSPEAGRCTITD